MKIPKKQKDILVKDFLEYRKLLLSIEESEEKPDEKHMLYKTLNIFYNTTDYELDKLPYKSLKDMFKIITNILSMPQELIRTFTIDKIEYGIIPNLDEMSFGEMVDCDTDDVIQQIAVLYRPITNKFKDRYLVKEYEANVEIMEWLNDNLTLDIYNGFISFFLNISQHILNSTLNYMVKEVGLEAKLKKDLEINGLGFHGFMN